MKKIKKLQTKIYHIDANLAFEVVTKLNEIIDELNKLKVK